MGTGGIGTDRSVTLDREEVAKREVGHTTVSPRVARALVAWFLTMLVALPLLELAGPRREGAVSPWSPLADGISRARHRLASWAEPSPGAWPAVVAANREALGALSAYETALEDQSSVGALLRPPMQQALSGWLGAGNERVYVGRGGWLFYRPDVEYVTGPGFLEPAVLERRAASASEYETPPQPDPRPAILQFHRDLAARGIHLVLVPTPVKPTIHPDRLAASASSGPVHNPSYEAFVADLRRAGVLVFEPASVLAALAPAPQYLATDTHWRPDAMQQAAAALAELIRSQVDLPDRAAAGYAVEPREARQTGDTAAMLDLPPRQTLYPPERVLLRHVVDASGTPWRPTPGADVLLLGDSFTNIYSLASMGWGEAAGFAEQLSYLLQRPLDRIVQNDDGAWATRELLRRDVEGGGRRLAHTRVVVWQFAARELTAGDWRVLPLPPAP